ncbi:MAG: hypothetical protein ABI623_07740, partial [bacterium]
IGNYIGPDVTGTQALPNAEGVFIYNNAPNNVIGGTTAAERNVIAYNVYRGVDISSGTGNMVRMNKIYSSGTGLGIDLNPTGLTPNDSLDGDTGANNLQNFPLLDSARVAGGYTIINGRFNSKPSASFTIDFFSNANYNPSHFGEGEIYIGSTTLNTNAAGNDSIRVTLPVTVSPDRYITATATDAAGNTSEFSQALCLADQDSDGIMDSWETQNWGIDVNEDGVIDLDLYALGARINHKDMFVEVDAMKGLAPFPGVLDDVVAAFSNANDSLVNNPDHANGVNLHYILDDTTIAVKNFPHIWTDFDSIKTKYFGTAAERSDPNGRYILQAKNLVYRYGLFARSFTLGSDTAYSGIAELENFQGGNDFMVTLGSVPWGGGTHTQQAGTFMHEMGHTLGLGHGGGDHINYKPNYISVMSYTWQTPFKWANTWRLNYSYSKLPSLDESNLDEAVGLNPPVGIYPVFAVPFSFTDSDTFYIHHVYARMKANTGIDYTRNGDSTQTGVAMDLNNVNFKNLSPGQMLDGFSDWRNLKYNFRNSPAFTPGFHTVRPTDVTTDELSYETFNIIDNIPPPKPSGRFIMDGQLDASATLLASNGGVNLYAAVSGTQLYVATNSAQSQSADMFIYLAAPPGSLQNAAGGKTGQVAAWSAVLGNQNTDNSSQWYDGTSSPMNTISVDTAGTVLEGVIDIELLLGAQPNNVYLAVGKYGTNNGGVLIGQSPSGNGNGDIEAAEFYSFNTPLPVQLASFTAKIVSGRNVRLDWTTVSEVNNYGFEVQKKANGGTEFVTVENSFIPGHGTTIEPHSYMFVDSSATL